MPTSPPSSAVLAPRSDMAGPSTHAVVTASGYERWSHCTAAPRFEEQFPDGSSVYAEEGTLAHAVCELYGRKKFTVMSKRKFNGDLKKLMENPLWSDEMTKTAEFYVDVLTEKANAFDSIPLVFFETRVDLTDYIPDGFGTCDCIMAGGDTLRIFDYKHGKGVPVSSIGNGQMRLYALGALKHFEPIFGDAIQRVCTAIVQPRITEDVTEEWMTVDELKAWGEELKPKAQAAYLGVGAFEAGEWCRFCKGKAQCRARAEYYAGFSQYADAVPEGRADDATRESGCRILSDKEIGDLLQQAASLAAWVGDLQDYARDAILAGREIPGWKVVEGRQIRAFKDPDRALDVMRGEGYDDAVLYERKPLSLAQLEKLLGKKRFAELMLDNIVYPPGKPTLVSLDDEREPYSPIGPNEFAGVTNGDA